MNFQSPSFADMAHQFLETLSPDQANAFRDLLAHLRRDMQEHLTSLSKSTSEAYGLLDQITQVTI